MLAEGRTGFGALLRLYRTSAGFSQEALAERAGLSRRGIADLERGARSFPYGETVRRLADALELDTVDRATLLTAAHRPPSTADARTPLSVESSAAGLSTERTNLPVRRTVLFGREGDVRALRELVLQVEGRLITLTGAGGSGKTSLGLEVARGLVEHFEDGVSLVELASVADPDLVTQVVASALGVRESPERPLLESLIAYLRPRTVLLVLDNCEHLVGACAVLVDRLLATCADLRILATSREPLRIRGEVTWRVASLAFPDPRRLPPLDELSELPAVRLFAERARAAESTFTISARNALAVAQVCSRVDGMPLALELAAARVQALTVDKLAERLHDSFRLLVGGSRTAPSRHQTLKATLDWSYSLLDPGEQSVLRRLAVFAGGFELEAAEAVCCGEATEPTDVLDLLTRLVAKSLAQVEERDGEARYRLLETVRAYALEHLEGSGEAGAVRAGHAAYYLGVAEQAAAAVWGPQLLAPFGKPEQVARFARLEQEHDNLRAALTWAAVHGQVDSLARLGVALWAFWFVDGYIGEGWRWAGQGLDRGPGLPVELRTRLLGVAGALALWRGDYARAAGLFEEALPLFRALGDDWNVGFVLAGLGLTVTFRGELAEGRRLLEESLAVYRALNDAFGIGLGLLDLGEVAWYACDAVEARALLKQAVAPLRRAGDVYQLVEALINLGGLELGVGEIARAADLAREGLALLRESGLRFYLPEALELAAGVAARQGETERAAQLFGAAESVRETTGAARYPTSDAVYTPALEAVRTALPAAAFDLAWVAGRALAPRAAVDLAITTPEPPPSRLAGRPHGLLAHLTPREREVAFLIARGLTNRQIAEALTIAEGTAAVHVNHILGKLECSSRAQIAALVGAEGHLPGESAH